MRLLRVLQLIVLARFHLVRGSLEAAATGVQNGTPLPEVHGDKFYYFGFGSNMLAERIHMQNPTAVRVGAVLLPDYRLDFAGPRGRWNGAVGTIVPTPNAETWGTLWEIELSNLPDIDNQEGVHLGIYSPLTVQVRLASGEEWPARAYYLIEQPESNLYELAPEEVPEDRQPSKTYLQCLVKGAIESEVPQEYVRRLQAIKHNGRVAKNFEDRLQLKDVPLLS